MSGTADTVRDATGQPRKVTEVAVGVMIQSDGRFLLAQRPAGKPYEGYWEFPGGKLEAGETVEAALARELHEELGLDVTQCARWRVLEHDYPHAYVRLHFARSRPGGGARRTRGPGVFVASGAGRRGPAAAGHHSGGRMVEGGSCNP